ncbi:hypothetical protein DL89DRAFT_264886 [Linderina pennispora]|uniref:Uncharacterized protein n=1 Tax=Linderina pennispora TaxID=61395 RepID=A0A1Y1WGR1_9FUNG|nr:uncharacterized protein DL89DRAFT_264886 [Linderina pennispora]ORX72677.1 hypothetical protein DL89DRAFT_264886 [Linderina pennispora]
MSNRDTTPGKGSTSAAPVPEGASAAPKQFTSVEHMSAVELQAVSTVLLNMHEMVEKTDKFNADLDGPTTEEWIEKITANIQFFIDAKVPTASIIQAIKGRLDGKVKAVIGDRKFVHKTELKDAMMQAFPQARFAKHAREKLGKVSTFKELPVDNIKPLGMKLLRRAELNDTHCIMLAETLAKLDAQAWYATETKPSMATTANIEQMLTTFQRHYDMHQEIGEARKIVERTSNVSKGHDESTQPGDAAAQGGMRSARASRNARQRQRIREKLRRLDELEAKTANPDRRTEQKPDNPRQSRPKD